MTTFGPALSVQNRRASALLSPVPLPRPNDTIMTLLIMRCGSILYALLLSILPSPRLLPLMQPVLFAMNVDMSLPRLINILHT
eukprot:5844900-Pyramimonas_sp.AAC.1